MAVAVDEFDHRLAGVELDRGTVRIPRMYEVMVGWDTMLWAIENPRRGIVESEELDHERILSIMQPYLGPLVGQYSDWTPLTGRGDLFPEDVDRHDPWQFRNVVVR